MNQFFLYKKDYDNLGKKKIFQKRKNDASQLLVN